MQELVDKVNDVLKPLIISINRHDKLNKLNYGIGGGSILSAIKHNEIKDTDFDIYLNDLKVGDYFYKILNDLGYFQYHQNIWTRKFKNYNNYIDVIHLRSFTPFQYVHNVDLTISSGFLDNNFIFYCRPEFFDDVNSNTLNIVNLNKEEPVMEFRLNKLKDKGFKLNKKSEKLFNTYKRGMPYKKLLTPIEDDEILIFK